MQTLLAEVGLITLYIVAHLYVDIVIIYSVMYILTFTNEKVLYIYIYIYTHIYIKPLCAVCSLRMAKYISQNML